jgi:hypothetical protein
MHLNHLAEQSDKAYSMTSVPVPVADQDNGVDFHESGYTRYGIYRYIPVLYDTEIVIAFLCFWLSLKDSISSYLSC